MSPILFIAGLVAAIATTATPVAPRPGAIAIFKDWAVGCDNGGNCQAVSLVPDEGGTGFEDWNGPVSLVRTPGGDDIFRIRVLFELEGMDRYRMTVDGELVDTGAIVDGEYPIEIVGADAMKVAKAIISGKHLVVEGPEGERITRISLSGSSAALRYMDQQQHRADTATALVSRGSKPFNPATTDIPVIMVDRWKAAELIPDTAAIVALAEDSKCREERFGLVEDQAVPLGSRDGVFRALVLISCGAGAYNFSSAPYIGEFRENDPQGWTFTPAKFDRQPSWGGDGSQPLLVNAGWDDKQQTLGSYGKGRGLGDCGSAENYIWDGDRFRLIGASAMPVCRGAYEWITTWRADYREAGSAAEVPAR